MFAVIRTGGKQYKVASGDVIRVERLAVEAGSEVELDEVLMVAEGGVVAVGTPLVADATVTAEVVAQDRGPKIIVFKKKRRQNYRRKNGHRQDLTVLRITGINHAVADAASDHAGADAASEHAGADAASEHAGADAAPAEA
jgi:large subunit ribosomal protein L21